MRIFTTVLISFGLAVALPLGAASAKKAAPAKAKAKSKAKSKATAKKAKPAVARAPQTPTLERYTEIQQALVDRGYMDSADGKWGPSSVAALKKFQQDLGLPVDGKLGALSLTALGLGPRRAGSMAEAISAGILPSSSAPTPLD